MKRLLLLVVLGAAGLMLTPAMASAQFGRPFGVNFQQRNVVTGPFNSPFLLPRYATMSSVTLNSGIPTLFGNSSITLTRAFVTQRSNAYLWAAGAASLYSPNYAYNQSGSYMTGSANSRSDFWLAEQRNMARAQREMSQSDVKSAINDQRNYENGNNSPLQDVAPLQDPIRVALAPTDPATVRSGEVLNTLLKEIGRVEDTNVRKPSAYVPPLLLEDLRFGGTPAGDLFSLTRQAGTLDFPPVFNDPTLAPLQAKVEQDFATVAASVQAGKSPDSDKLKKLEDSFQKLQDAATSLIKNLPFEDASAAHHFLNQMANAIKALKSGTGTGLIDPKWSKEGLTVSDLVRHMNKYKLQFAAAPSGGEEAYTTMHRNLATYLFVLNQTKK